MRKRGSSFSTTNIARGGAETQVAGLAIELRQRGWDVHIVSLVKPSAFEEELGAAGVPLHFNGVVRLPFVIRRLRPQILHCHMFHANIAGRLLRLIMPFRGVICTLHSVAESGRGSTASACATLCTASPTGCRTSRPLFHKPSRTGISSPAPFDKRE